MTAEVFFIKAQDLSDRTLRMMFESMEVSGRIPKDSSVALKRRNMAISTRSNG